MRRCYLLAAAGRHGCWFPLVKQHRMRNGAGKTTAMRILLTLLRPAAGVARVAGGERGRDGPAIGKAHNSIPPLCRGMR
jgi:hypothetical protein